jgi:hypothetical protein
VVSGWVKRDATVGSSSLSTLTTSTCGTGCYQLNFPAGTFPGELQGHVPIMTLTTFFARGFIPTVLNVSTTNPPNGSAQFQVEFDVGSTPTNLPSDAGGFFFTVAPG